MGDNRWIEERAVRDRDAGRYDPPYTWVPGEWVPPGSPERIVYDEINPKDGEDE